jgi:exopolyphosphatase/guanosine-5'-triphosphate,3'-diphosphate pyrophosphatase
LRVEDTALHIWKSTCDTWGLAQDESEMLLRWAAALHEIGLTIAYAGHHKHASYLIEHSAMAGFSQNLKHQLALMIRHQRRKFNTNAFHDLPTELSALTVKLAIILRLSILLHRARDPQMDVLPDVMVSGTTIQLRLHKTFLASHPLTVADLTDEQARLKNIGYQLEFV